VAYGRTAQEETDMDVETVALKAEVMALKLVGLSLIDVLPEVQRTAICSTTGSFATASDSHGADFPAFSIGEDATSQMNDTLKQIIGLVAQFHAIRLGPKTEGTPVG
jgi:hypothetical protein